MQYEFLLKLSINKDEVKQADPLGLPILKFDEIFSKYVT